MKKFLLLHFGFEQPTPEIMAAWEKCFESIADKTVDQGGLSSGREISKSGTKDLPWGMESITGYNIIEAEDLDAAGKIAQDNPYIASIRVYEIRSKQGPVITDRDTGALVGRATSRDVSLSTTHVTLLAVFWAIARDMINTGLTHGEGRSSWASVGASSAEWCEAEACATKDAAVAGAQVRDAASYARLGGNRCSVGRQHQLEVHRRHRVGRHPGR